MVLATDAPLIPTQLKRIARKISLGLGRDGSYSGDGSGDIFIAFSTANPGAVGTKGLHQLTMLPNDSLDPIFLATVQATEEAVVNAMVAAETMTGINNHTVIALPHDRLREVLKKYNRLRSKNVAPPCRVFAKVGISILRDPVLNWTERSVPRR